MTFKDLFNGVLAAEVFYITEDMYTSDRIDLSSEAFIKKREYLGSSTLIDSKYVMAQYRDIELDPTHSKEEYTEDRMKFTFYADKMEALRTFVNKCRLKIREINMGMAKQLSSDGINMGLMRRNDPTLFSARKVSMQRSLFDRKRLSDKITEAYNLIYS